MAGTGYMYKYVLTNGNFYVGRDMVSSMKRAKDHLQNALHITSTEKNSNKRYPIISQGFLGYSSEAHKWTMKSTKPSVFEKDWGLAMNPEVLQGFAQSDVELDEQELIDLFNYGGKHRILTSIASYSFKKKGASSWEAFKKESNNIDDDIQLAHKFKSAANKDSIGLTKESKDSHIPGILDLGEKNFYTGHQSDYALQFWSAIPNSFWNMSSAFNIKVNEQNKEIVDLLGTNRLDKILQLFFPSVFKYDEDTIECLLTINAYQSPDKTIVMLNNKAGNIHIENLNKNTNSLILHEESKGFKLNLTSMIEEEQYEFELDTSIDQQTANLLGKMIIDYAKTRQGYDLSNKKITAEYIKNKQKQLKELKKQYNQIVKREDNNKRKKMDKDINWKELTPILKKLGLSNTINTKSKIEEAFKIQEYNNRSLQISYNFMPGDPQEGLKRILQFIEEQLVIFCGKDLNPIWKQFANTEQMLKLSLAEIYYDSVIK